MNGQHPATGISKPDDNTMSNVCALRPHVGRASSAQLD